MSDVKFCAKSNGATPEAEKWSKRKCTQKKKHPKTAKKKAKTRKKRIRLFKSSNIWGESYLKPCAESNGTTPCFENWFYEKICPKN